MHRVEANRDRDARLHTKPSPFTFTLGQGKLRAVWCAERSPLVSTYSEMVPLFYFILRRIMEPLCQVSFVLVLPCAILAF